MTTDILATARHPCLLVAEDDPVSARFLQAALEQLGATVTLAVNGDEALDMACRTRFELLLLDHHLPGLDGIDILRQLRRRPEAASARTPAIATSAEWTPEKRQRMLAAGHVAVLAKPCDLNTLRQLLEQHVPPANWPSRHDAAALQAVSGPANLAALRRLFANELEEWSQHLHEWATRPDELTDRLHRLCASSGFCGAPALGSAGRQWLARLRAGEPDAAEHEAFRVALVEARRAFPVPADQSSR